jgi:hypothetical protein
MSHDVMIFDDASHDSELLWLTIALHNEEEEDEEDVEDKEENI